MIEVTMKRKVAFLLVFLVLVAGVVGVVRVLRGSSTKQGELRVESASAVGIFLNDKHLGRTPFRDKVTAGEYTIKLVPEGTAQQLASWQGPITVGANLLTYVNADLSESELSSAVDVLWLEKISGKNSELSITTNPDGATLLVDDESKGITPLTTTDVAPGDHSVVLRSQGFMDRTLKIKTTPGYRVIVNLKLALATGSAIPQGGGSPAPGVGLPGSSASTKTATSSAGGGMEPAKPFVIIKDTPTGFLRVRMGPTTDATEAARVNPGEKYHMVDSQNGWYQINYDGANSGWISGQYAERVE